MDLWFSHESGSRANRAFPASHLLQIYCSQGSQIIHKSRAHRTSHLWVFCKPFQNSWTRKLLMSKAGHEPPTSFLQTFLCKSTVVCSTWLLLTIIAASSMACSTFLCCSQIHNICLHVITSWDQQEPYTVEPLNKGHFGASHVVLWREVVLFSEVQNVLVL